MGTCLFRYRLRESALQLLIKVMMLAVSENKGTLLMINFYTVFHKSIADFEKNISETESWVSLS